MRLESFRILNCFGFVDSGKINLGGPGNLVYFLGRNSSGKSAVLRAISHFQYDKIPEQHPKFANYETPARQPLLVARFSTDPSGNRTLSMDTFMSSVLQQFSVMSWQIQGGEEGFSVSPVTPATNEAVHLLNRVYQVYSELIERIQEGGQVWAERLAKGSYRLLTEDDDYESFDRRYSSVQEGIGNLEAALSQQGQPHSLRLDFWYLERQLLMQFPEILVFTDRFSLNEDLPPSLGAEHLKGGYNALTDAFVSLLGRETLRDLLQANKLARKASLQKDLQDKLDALCNSINQDAMQGVLDEKFVRIHVDRAAAVRIILEVDGKESYYEHLSDNTTFLIAYHVYQKDRERKNSVPSILLFDEPNKGFHPSAETKVLRFLESLASHNQVLVATHSQHLIDLDRLGAVRIMSRAEDGTLRVENELYRGSGASTDTLALQPVTEAIGLRYADQLVIRDKVVITEGYTELLYLRFFARLLGRDEPNLAPVTGESKILTFVPFLISQGISFKVALDSSKMRNNIQKSVPILHDSCYSVAEYLGAKAPPSVGIEDLFSKDDFEMLLNRCGHTINEKHFSNVSNSEYAKNTGIKALVAREAYEAIDLQRTHFSLETIESFEVLLSFCENDRWFKA